MDALRVPLDVVVFGDTGVVVDPVVVGGVPSSADGSNHSFALGSKYNTMLWLSSAILAMGPG